jgi:hypothetical protein
MNEVDVDERGTRKKPDWRRNRFGGTWCIRDLEQWFEQHVVLPEGLRFVLALWVMHTYIFEAFDATPYLALTSPMKQCGKTQLCTVLELLCPRAEVNLLVTGPTLFRMVESYKPTLILDEAEALGTKSPRIQDLLSVLQSGYKPGGTVKRTIGGEVKEFRVFCPKAFAVIGDVPEVLRDRCLSVPMRRKRSDEVVERLRRRFATCWAEGTRASAERWTNEHIHEIQRQYERLSLPELSDRDEELWLPLFAIAAVAVPARVGELQATAIRMSRQKRRKDSVDAELIRLLGDLRIVTASEGGPGVWTENLLSGLRKVPEGIWGNMTSTKLAMMLRAFDVEPDQVFMKGQNKRGYNLKRLREVIDNYLPEAA